ncbi:MAG: hypothetical protein OXD49_04560 [Candidatus Poribacteria bacterium]|nr:hypothetical protein [Candidatus Poribacteria bacterium]
MRRQVPLALCFLFGMVMIVAQFSPHSLSQAIYKEVVSWVLIISPFALILATLTLIQTHATRIRRRTEHWRYSLVVFAGLLIMVVVGIPFGPQNSVFEWLYNNVQVPMDATMFSLLAFFIASAAYRAFRARAFEATLLLVSAMIVMLGNVPIGDYIWNTVLSWIPWEDGASKARQWILDIPNLAARRGIILGVSLGVISQSIRIILGIERSYLGGGD